MARSVEKILSEMRTNPEGVNFTEALKVADHFFGEFGKPRIAGSHHIYKMPWPGGPRINFQRVAQASEAAKGPARERPPGKKKR